MNHITSKGFIRNVVVVTLCLATLLIFLIIIPERKPIDDQVVTLYRQAELVEQDFSSIWEMSNVNIYIGETKVVITYSERYCNLKLSYDKNGQCLAKELDDIRLCSTTGGLICGILLLLAVSFLAATVIMLAVYEICKRHAEKKASKRENKHTE